MSSYCTPPSILVIDDQPANLHLLSELLGNAGFDVRAVLDGESGLRTAHRLPPDLVLLDIQMPQLDGYEVCRRFKASRELADIPIIFLSAAEETVDKVQAFGAGGVDYIVRPFHLDEVLARVNTHIKLYHAYREAHELAVLRERERVARELHDAVSQTLFSLKLTAETALRQHAHQPGQTPGMLLEISQLAHEAMVEMRVLVHELRSETFETARLDERIAAVVQTLTKDASLQVVLQLDQEIALPPHVQIAFYRIAQEALANVVRHARARCAEISLERDGQCARLKIRDDGCGFDVAHVRSGHYGLANIRGRAADLGATCSIESRPGRGTTIIIECAYEWDGEHD